MAAVSKALWEMKNVSPSQLSPFPASFILTYHTVLLLLPLLPHLSFLLEMSGFLLHVCTQTSAWPHPGVCVSAGRSAHGFGKHKVSEGVHRTGTQVENPSDVWQWKALPGGTLSDRPAGSACLRVSHMHMRGNGAGRGNVSLTYGFECCFYCYC